MTCDLVVSCCRLYLMTCDLVISFCRLYRVTCESNAPGAPPVTGNQTDASIVKITQQAIYFLQSDGVLQGTTYYCHVTLSIDGGPFSGLSPAAIVTTPSDGECNQRSNAVLRYCLVRSIIVSHLTPGEGGESVQHQLGVLEIWSIGPGRVKPMTYKCWILVAS